MASSYPIRIGFTLEMASDFHIGSGVGMTGIADRKTLRNARQDLVIPGSTIKGRTRHHCEQLARVLNLKNCSDESHSPSLCTNNSTACLVCRLFGSEWLPGSLRFSDALLTDSIRGLVRGQSGANRKFDYQVIMRTRIRMNRVLRRAAEGALYTFEEGASGLMFCGHITGSLVCTASQTGILLEPVALIASLLLMNRIGGKKTIGLGECRVAFTHLALPVAFDIEHLPEQIQELVLYDDYRCQ